MSTEQVEIVLPVLHAVQQRIKDDPAKFKVVMSGRRVGKTMFGVSEASEGVVMGEQWAWFAPTYKYSTEVWREFRSILGPVIVKENAKENRIEVIGGGILEIWTLEGAKAEDVARGRKYNGVVIDEAGIVPNLVDIFNAAIRPSITAIKDNLEDDDDSAISGRALFLGTPKGRRHGFISLFQRGESSDPKWKDWASFKAKTIDNPYIPASEIEEARAELPPAIFAQEYEAEPSDDGLNPFGLKELARAVSEASTEDTVCYGVDLARAQDWTVVVGLDSFGRWTTYDRWQFPWAETKAKIRGLARHAPCMVDATGVGDAIFDDLAMSGMNVHRFVFHTSSKRELVQRLITAFAGQKITIADGDPYKEFKAYEVEYTVGGKVKYSSPSGMHDDTIMAWGLALTMYERMGMIGWQSEWVNPHQHIIDRVDPDAVPALREKLERARALQGVPVLDPFEQFI